MDRIFLDAPPFLYIGRLEDGIEDFPAVEKHTVTVTKPSRHTKVMREDELEESLLNMLKDLDVIIQSSLVLFLKFSSVITVLVWSLKLVLR